MVASDRSIGGFCHSWGEDQPKVQEKKRMLEEEGIKFESDGMKIMSEHFIAWTKACTKKKTNATKQSSSRTNNKMRRIPAAVVDEITEEMLKKEILQLLNKRAPGKTC